MSKLLFNPLSGNFDIVYNKAEEIEFVPAVPAQWSGTIANTEEALNTIKADIADNQALVKEPTGFVDRTSTTLSINSIAREFTISPVGASFDVYVKGNKYTKTAESIVLSNTSGNHYIYYNAAGVLSETSIFDPSIFENNALVSIIYWNTDTNFYSYFADERHGLVMDGATHGYLHTVFGARYLSGLALQGFTVDGDGDADISAKFQADSGKIRDEDILVELPLTLNIPVLYREGALWRKKSADPYPVIYNGSVAGYSSARLAYNQFTGGAWQLTQVTDGDFVLCHVFATNDIETPFVAIAGINQYANIPAARAGAESEISSLSGLPFAEFVAVGTVIYQTDSAYNNTPKARVRSAAAGEPYVDFRGEQLYTPSGVATSHSLLSNLSSDDHLQYYNEARGDARYVLKTGDTMTGTLSVDVSGAGTSSLAWGSLQFSDPTFFQTSHYNLDELWIQTNDVGVEQLNVVATSSQAYVQRMDLALGTSTMSNITPGTISLTFSDGLTTTPVAPTLPEHVTTKAYVDAAVVTGVSDKVSKTGDTMSGTLSVSVPASGTSNLDWQGVTAQSANGAQSVNCILDYMSIYYNDPGLFNTSTEIYPNHISLAGTDIGTGNTSNIEIQEARITLTTSDGVTTSPTIPLLPEEVTTKEYVDKLAVLSVISPSINTTMTVNNKVALCSNTITITLPLASAVVTAIYVKNIGTGVITVDGNGSQTIDGALTYALTNQWDSITLVSNGTGWFIL